MGEFGIGRRRPLQRRIDDTAAQNTMPVSNDRNVKVSDILHSKETCGNNRKRYNRSTKSPEDNPHKVLPPIEVDLHIYELVDTTVGMDNYTMLQFQLDTVRKTMKKHRKRIGQKIVFIHGKGDGVLRKEVRTLLAKEYASCDVQDASFLKYGFGATQVTIRGNQSPT